MDIGPPWELKPASCRAGGIGVLVDQESLEISYTSLTVSAETPSVPPTAYTLSPEWPATRLARAVVISASLVQVFVCGSYISTSFVTLGAGAVPVHPPKTNILPPGGTAAQSERGIGSGASALQVA